MVSQMLIGLNQSSLLGSAFVIFKQVPEPDMGIK
jgi:hypothetical protein